MKAQQFLYITLLVLFSVLCSYENESRICIISRNVRSIDISPNHKIFACSDKERAFSQLPAKKAKSLLSDIATIDRFLKYTLNYTGPAFSIFLENSPDSWREDILNHFLAHLNEKRNLLERSILIDILSYAIFNSSKMESLVSNGPSYYSEKAACIYGLVPKNKSTEYCNLLLQIPYGKSGEMISDWSFRPILYLEFLNYYKKLNIDQRKKYLNKLVDFWTRDPNSAENSITAADSTFDSYEKIYSNLCKKIVGKCEALNKKFTLIRWVDFHPPENYASLQNKIHLKPPVIHEVDGFLHTQFGSIKTEGFIKSQATRVIWVYKESPNLKDFKDITNSSIDVYRQENDSFSRLSMPLVHILFKAKMIGPYSKWKDLESEKIKTWLKFSPIQKL